VANETTITSVTNQVQTGYDLAADFALRTIPIFDQFATTKSADTNKGSSITFHRWTELGETASAINEVTDVTPVELASSTFTVTPLEYGSVTVTTSAAREQTMLPSFSADQVNLVAYTMALSIDSVCRAAMDASGEERWIGQASEAAITATDILTADEVRKEHAYITNDNVMPFGSDYVWVLDPYVAYDLKSETGDGAWVSPAQYVNTDKIYNNEVGKFGGFKFIESDRCTMTVDGGASTTDTYHNYIFGADNTAKAVLIAPHLVRRPPIDYLQRLESLGWYAMLGYDTFRSEASRLVLCASSIGAN
jgi:N4-gp56 family major capsid protein